MCEQPEQFRRFNLAQFVEANEQEPVATEEFMPTHAWPGTAEKTDVLRDRFQQGLPLWHRDDFRWDRGEVDE